MAPRKRYRKKDATVSVPEDQEKKYNEQLVILFKGVKTYPEIYNPKIGKTVRDSKKKRFWKHVAEVAECPSVKNAIKKWKKMALKLSNHLKTVKRTQLNPQPVRLNDFIYYPFMKFAIPLCRQRVFYNYLAEAMDKYTKDDYDANYPSHSKAQETRKSGHKKKTSTSLYSIIDDGI